MTNQDSQPQLDSEFELMQIAFLLFRSAEDEFPVHPVPGSGVVIKDEDIARDLVTEEGWVRPLKAGFIVPGIYADYRVLVQKEGR